MSLSEKRAYTPRLIAWEVTRFCLLACKHCRAAARAAAYAGELSTEECFKLLENIASFSRPLIILTGGEPMLRSDVYEIAARGCELGLPVVMAPCGVLVNDESAAKIVHSGIRRISISLDGASAESHDSFRGVNGAFEACLRGIEAAKHAGLEFQINAVVSQHNVAELPAILDLAVELGASVFNPFSLVPTGRGRQLADQEVSAEQYEKTLHWLASQEDRLGIRIRVTCAPQYQRILRQRRVPVELAHGRPAGCLGGKSFAFISHRGKVQICGFLDVECGDVRREDYDFRKIWETSEVFQQVRDLDSYRGRCGYCEFRRVCGGCRARAYALTDDYLAEEPFCLYQPKRQPADCGSDDPRNLDELDNRVLSVIQTDLPVCERPFEALAERLGHDGEEVVARITRLRADKVIRRLGPVFDSRRLGYVSTLVGARIPAERLDETARLVNQLPGVTHNYRRQHAYNLWFTVTAKSAEDLERAIEDLRQRTRIPDFYSLPARAVYKTRVNFHLSDELRAPAAVPIVPGRDAIRLDESQKELVRLLQDGLPVTPEPFAKLARRLGWSTQRVLKQISDWLAAGVIRRFGATIDHRKVGFRSNGMAVFCAPLDRIDAAGAHLALYPEVTHCYHRRPLPDWPCNLFAMVHGRSAEAVLRFVACVAGELDLTDYEVLFSTTEYKKTSMRYFV